MRFHQHPDGVIIVETADGIYIDTPENFALDYGEAAPALPDGMVERFYSPERHFVADAKGNAFPTNEPFPFGDAAMRALATLLSTQAARQSERR